MALLPSSSDSTGEPEYPEHDLRAVEGEIPFYYGYRTEAIARLDSAGMEVEPEGNQVRTLYQGTPVEWRWTVYPKSAGRHRLGLTLGLRWTPEGGGESQGSTLWQGTVDVRVHAPLGLKGPQARALGIAGLLAGGVLVLPLAEFAARRRVERARAERVRRARPNPDLDLELSRGVTLNAEEEQLVRGQFGEHGRLIVERKFRSGYSGANTYLLRPVRKDGRAEARAIVKIGSKSQIRGEYRNYEAYVRHSLPPMTARVQGPPLLVGGVDQALIQYTFVGRPGGPPESLGDYARRAPAAGTARLLQEELFETFGPTWWMQRTPFLFTLDQVYDGLLPVHLVVREAPGSAPARVLQGEPSDLDGLAVGEAVALEGGVVVERRVQRGTVTVRWPPRAGHGPLRVRVHDQGVNQLSEGQEVRGVRAVVLATRRRVLEAEVHKPFPEAPLSAAVLRFGGGRWANPLGVLDWLLSRRISGSRSMIHGDLNLENILVGPGGLVWLIDFAATGEGHTLFDFVRLEAELTTQVVAERFAQVGLGCEDFLNLLHRLEERRAPAEGEMGEMQRLLEAARGLARRCLTDPQNLSEWRLPLVVAYLGTLKFSNLDELGSAPLPKGLAFLAAAYLLTQEREASASEGLR
jgi:hypothetical protein